MVADEARNSWPFPLPSCVLLPTRAPSCQEFTRSIAVYITARVFPRYTERRVSLTRTAVRKTPHQHPHLCVCQTTSLQGWKIVGSCSRRLVLQYRMLRLRYSFPGTSSGCCVIRLTTSAGHRIKQCSTYLYNTYLNRSCMNFALGHDEAICLIILLGNTTP